MLKNKTIYVPARFKDVFKNQYAEDNDFKDDKNEEFIDREFNYTNFKVKEVKTGVSDREIDGDRLNQDVNMAIKNLNNEGYEVVSVSPVTSGNYRSLDPGYGWSYTSGVLILARMVE